MWKVIEKVFGLDQETWEECRGTFETSQDAQECYEAWDANGAYVFVRFERDPNETLEDVDDILF